MVYINNNLIYEDVEFKARTDDFFCNNLCGVRYHCENSDDYDGEGDINFY